MLDAYLAANVAIAGVLLLIDLFIISKNSQAKINRIFFVAVLFMSAWILANYFSNDQNLSRGAALFANHLVLFFSSLLIYYLAFFVSLLSKFKLFTKYSGQYGALNYIVAFLTLTPLVIESISKQNAVYAIAFGPLAFMYFLLLGINVVIIFYAFVYGLKHSTGLEKIRIQNVFLSLMVSIGFIFLTNAIIPLVTGSFALTNIGPLFSVIFVAGVAYGIIRHRLFDIKLVVARSVAYVLLLGTLALIFAASMIALTSLFFQDESVTRGLQATYMLLALGMAVIFQPLKRFFDRVTNNLFYRDAYDAQAFLDELNGKLVSNIDLDRLLGSSSQTIIKYLKSEFCGFGIHQPGSNSHRVLASHSLAITEEEFRLLHHNLHPKHTKVLIATDITDTDSQMSTLLQHHSIAVVVALVTHQQEVGYLFLGNKKSGNLYSKQDKKMMEIIAEELAIAIQNALRFEEIEQFNVTLQQKIDDATLKLKHANTRLKELDEAKDEFVSMASHQLRTPLTVIKGYLSMLLEGDMGKVTKQQKEIIQTAYDGAERMVFLIGDLLNVSRLQTGKFQIENQSSDLSAIIDHEVSHLQESAANHQLKLTFDKPKDFPKFMLDETKIRQVIMNFIDNAIYYTPAGGSIDVKLEATDQEIRFTVNDTGLGVPKAEQHHLFSKFYRAGNARKMRPDGTGLGLYMAKKIIVAQGGAIIFKSEEGKGSTFGFSLPKKAVGQ